MEGKKQGFFGCFLIFFFHFVGRDVGLENLTAGRGEG